VRRDNGHEIAVKGNDDDGWSFDGVMLWLGRKQNGYAVEWWEEWPKLKRSFYSSRVWEFSGPGRVACSGRADSMLHFRLELGGDKIKH
jgi:hypothetical protein